MQHKLGFRSRALTLVMVAGATLAATPLVGVQPAWAVSKNLIKNGGAELGTGGSGAVVDVPNWTRSTGGSFTVIGYASGSGGPTPTSPGPKKRGANFFAGGPDDPSNAIIATQVVKLNKFAAAIADGGVTFNLNAWLGGFATQDDQASVEIDFKDVHGTLFKAVTIGPVLANARSGVTGLVPRATSGTVPSQTKTVLVKLILVRTAGNYNDAYADNLSLTLSGV